MIIALQTLLFFRESLVTLIERFLGPYYRRLSLKFNGEEGSDDEDSNDDVFAEYDGEKGVVFYPPVYAQRYAAVSDCLMDKRWCGKLEKVVDFGCHDMSFIKYLKDVPGIKHILGVDIETIPLMCSSQLLGSDSYAARRENPLKVTLFQGNAADPDYRLIGCDAVVAIEMIEHMLPHDLERLIHTVFGFIKPWVAIFTTPNGDFNVLFKALEKNGLRRLDHMFEWSREQFHEWCSNIVARYPDYTVTCKGIGPGPPDTIHLGCCSQLALFVAKDYTKQPDLDLNSLALVAKTSCLNDVNHLIGSWESGDSLTENDMLCAPSSVQSLPELMYGEPSCMSILTTPISYESLECKEKTLQCNLDSEIGKNFLMFDDELFSKVLMPRREKHCRVYEIEDVTSRLNCSTFQVKKFSKAAQNLMAKNKMDSYEHTREVVSEIRHLMKMLNFNKDRVEGDLEGAWCNINWGANAPYWNQYYKIVEEYNYPHEGKNDDTRILDLISEEINRLIDTQYDEEFTSDMHKLEIPIDQLMPVVEHITRDVHRVRELLEWNGYEVVDDRVIHSRLIVDSLSGTSAGDDWQEDTMSDWDTRVSKVPSTSFSDGSTIAKDYYGEVNPSGLRLHRAIDHKMRKLRTLLSADKDITTELDRVVCRLMKIALCTSKERQNPPPISWLQCKLFDLLTLTEKAIEKRRLQRYSLKAIEYQPHTKEPFTTANISDKDIVSTEMKIDSISERIVPKYHNFEPPTDRELDFNGDPDALNADNFKIDDYKISVPRNSFKDDENNDALRVDPNEQSNTDLANKRSDTCCLELVPYNSCGSTADEVKSEKSTCSSSNGVAHKDLEELNGSRFSTHSKILPATPSSARLSKKKSSRRPSYLKLMKFSFAYNKYKSSDRKKPQDYPMIQSTPSRPIPASLIKLCDSQSNKSSGKKYLVLPNDNVNGHCQPINDIAATEECMFIGIVTEDGEETIAMRRHIGISPEFDLDIIENEDLIQSVVNLSKDDSFSYETNIDMENIQSQTIFLYDLDQPSTSKGVRHLSADVQCGPDDMTPSMLSQTTSFEQLPKLFTTGIKIEEPQADVMKSNKITSDFGTCTDKYDNTVTIGRQSVGIKIEESIQNVIEYFTTEQIAEKPLISPSKLDEKTETKLLKPVSSINDFNPVSSSLKINDSGSEFCGSVGSCDKSPTLLATSSTNTSNEKNILIKISQASCNRRNLACGGVHVHSFKERQVSEDVVYLGEWQKEHKIIRSSIIRKSIPLPKRPRLHLKEHTKINKITKPSKKTISATKPQPTINNREKLNNADQNSNMNSTKTFCTRKNNITKKVAPSKMPIRSLKSNNLKTIYTKRSYNAIENNTKTEDKHLKIKNYLPLYLLRKRKTNITENKNSNKINLNSKHIEKENSTQLFSTGKVTRDLINIPEKKLVPDINYMVFRNEIQSKKDTNIHSPVAIATGVPRNDTLCRSHSPQSQHSSTCSSPNSVSTVRAVSTRNRVSSNRRNSTSSERSSSGILEADNKTQKSKKFSRRGKNNKKPPTLSNMLSDNKENFPECSKNPRKIEETLHKNDKVAKNVFIEGTKSVLVAQVTTETSTIPLISTNISKTNVQCISKTIKLANIFSRDGQAFEPPSSSVFDSSLDKNPKDKETENISSTSVPDENNDFVYESFTASLNNSFESGSCRSLNEANNSLKSVHNTKSSIISAIRKLIEHKLNLPENSYRSHDSDSETVILGRDDNYYNVESPPEEFDSKQSTNEVTFGPESDEDRSSIHCSNSVNENNALLCAPEIKSQNLESDAASLKSFASVSTSKFSEYYLADNELETTITEADRLNISSIQEIFERKELNAIPNAGALAIQAFSGFSVNEPITGDQPDFVNFIDSETGSFSFELARQTASEEIFVSGRSSDTYESCYVDDDAYVPNWLFNMISQQHSAEDSEAEEINLPVLPLVEPDYDLNGNVMEPGVGVGAGAGDGRGMHSDHSQDSSGRGSSLSSSETSSGLQSEVISNNPLNITSQEDHLREPINMSSVMEPSRPTASTVSNAGENNSVETLSHQNRIPSLNPTQVTSDVDADVSSLETDAVDSDN